MPHILAAVWHRRLVIQLRCPNIVHPSQFCNTFLQSLLSGHPSQAGGRNFQPGWLAQVRKLQTPDFQKTFKLQPIMGGRGSCRAQTSSSKRSTGRYLCLGGSLALPSGRWLATAALVGVWRLRLGIFWVLKFEVSQQSNRACSKPHCVPQAPQSLAKRGRARLPPSHFQGKAPRERRPTSPHLSGELHPRFANDWGQAPVWRFFIFISCSWFKQRDGRAAAGQALEGVHAGV
jgi:hypothetical protein